MATTYNTASEAEQARRRAITDELPWAIHQRELAQTFLAFAGEDHLYVEDINRWLAFAGATGWTLDRERTVLRRGLLATAQELETAPAPPNSTSSVKNRSYEKVREVTARRHQTVNGLDGAAKFAELVTERRVATGELDSDPTLLGVRNGVVDLSTGVKRPFDRETFVTQRTPHDYDPSATCPRFERFLTEVLGEDIGVQNYLHTLVGYLMTGLTTEQQMWMFVGGGANGKSTLLSVLTKLLGASYAQQAPEAVLMAKANPGAAQSELVRLRGARMAVLTETGADQALNESRVKALIAGDMIAARALYEDFIEFTPQAKFLLATNHLPRVQGSDKGIWRRLVVVPFEAEFEVGTEPNLMASLVAELPGILAWAVRGAKAYLAQGLPPVPTAWQQATASYRGEQDVVAAFLADCTEFVLGEAVGATLLYEAYRAWSIEEGRTSVSQTDFGTRVLCRDGVSRRPMGKANRKHYVGLRLQGVAANVTTIGETSVSRTPAPPCRSLLSPDGDLSEVVS